MPKDAPYANQVECIAHGADLNLVDGFITDAGRVSGKAAEERGFFYVSTLKEPYRVKARRPWDMKLLSNLGSRFQMLLYIQQVAERALWYLEGA
ncbi:MAG: hypothetical protein Ct9H300mP19_04800 [Dehalococcoidia bacterium]|nr:MAG: hypothetical protein Ct9H300mP19_04800 [Dehalococcoidia bacterium]